MSVLMGQEKPKRALDHKDDAVKIAELPGKPTPLRVALLWDAKQRSQFHVDVIKTSGISQGDLRPVNSSLEEIVKVLDSFAGSTIDGIMFGRYVLPISKLEETSLIRSSFFDVSKDDVEIKLVEGTIALKGTPVKSLEWQISPDGKMLVTDVNGWIDDEIFEDELLTKSFKRVNQWFQSLVLGERGDDPE